MRLSPLVKENFKLLSTVFYTDEKPVSKCIRCGNAVEPTHIDGKGYPTFQFLICDDCKSLGLVSSNVDNLEKIRRVNVKKIAIEQGCPSEKVIKITESDFVDLKFDVVIDSNKKTLNVNSLVKMLLRGDWIVIKGETDSSKTHLATYLCLTLLLKEYDVKQNEFKFATLLNICEHLKKDYSAEHFILNEYRLPRYLFLTFGEYRGELTGFGGEATPKAKDAFFQILDYRIENKTKKELTTILSTTLSDAEIKGSFGKSFLNRIYENSYLVELPERKERMKMFKSRPVLVGR